MPDLSTTSLPSNPPTPPSRTSEALKADLRAVNQQLEGMKEQWEREKKQLLGEKALLQDTAHKLNLQVQSAQDEAKRSAESGKVAQKARISVQAVSLIVSVSLCGIILLPCGLVTGTRNGEAIDRYVGVRAQGWEIQVTISGHRTRPV